MKIKKEFYRREDVVDLSRDFLGKVLCTRIGGKITSAIITETEAYGGETDKASHAWNGRRTERTEVMYAAGGLAYVYLCYGIHHLFNIVSGKKDVPHAILVRGVKPLKGVDLMMERRNQKKVEKNFSSGPGTAASALGIRTTHTGTDLTGNTIWIEDDGIIIPSSKIYNGPRIGVDYAGDDALLPYRFLVTEI